MKKFISKLLTILLTFTLCFFLFACAPSDNGNSGGLGEGGGESGGGGSNPPAQNSLITPAEMQAKVDAITESETLPQQTVAPAESTAEVTTDAEETTASPSGYTLKLDGDRLIVNAPDGTSVCERIIDTSSLHPKDREALISGILFSDERSAMSAIYDIIS